VGVLDTGPLRSLGSCSYSLYLTHAPIVVILYEKVVVGHVRPGVPTFLVSLAVVVPTALLFARLFAAVFEIPFRKHRSWAALHKAMAQPRRMSRRRRGPADLPGAGGDLAVIRAAVIRRE
jgi:peptidoglycan/LPS O-acetylase OafA/YrhL